MMTFDVKTRQRALIGILQGALLLWMHTLLERKAWPATSPTWVMSWYTLSLAVPLALQLMEDLMDSRSWRYAAGLAAVLGGLSVYTARTTLANMDSNAPESIAYFGLTVALAWYVALPFAQTWQKTGEREFPYSHLFDYSWNNILTVLTAAFFTSMVWGSLGLWAGMFKVIGIEFFGNLFTKRWFIYLVTGGVFGFALSIGRAQKGLITNLRGTMLLVFKYLLPLSAFIGVIFLAALPFTGLKPLWDTGHASALMLNLQLYMIIFLNSVYQDGKEKCPYPLIVRRLIEAGVIILPVYEGLCAYSLGLRVEQHGWSVSRVVAALSILIAALYALGYCRAALRQRPPWMKDLAPANVRIAVIVIGIAVGVNTPLLDPRRIALRSQVDRLMKGTVSAEKFDYHYLRFSLGKAGQKELERLSKLQNHPQAEKIREGAAAALAAKNRWDGRSAESPTTEELGQKIILFPEGKTLDPAFLQFLAEKRAAMRLQAGTPALLIDLNRDGSEEIILFGYQKEVFSPAPGGWKRIGVLQTGKDLWLSLPDREKQLREKNYQLLPPSEWDSLKVGGLTYQVAQAPEEDGPPAVVRVD